MELDPLQLMIIGAVASILAQLVKLVAARFGLVLPRWALTVVVYVVAIVLAVAFMKPALPDPAGPDFVLALVSLATAVLGAATVIYNVLLAKLLELLGWTKEQVLARADTHLGRE